MFDYHIHSNFSADCDTPMERTIERAVQLGVTEICFTEHIDFDYPDPSIDFHLDLEGYDRKIKDLQNIYGNQIKIKKGVELGVQPYLLEKYRKVLNKEKFDFIICSMHTTEKKDLHSGSFFDGKTVDEAFLMYYEELLYCVKQFEQFSILGHIDLVKRYVQENSRHDFHDVITEILKVIIQRGQGIELNTSGYRYGLKSGMPSIDILNLYKQLGGEVITLGSDSHVEETLAYEFKASLEILSATGFKYIATYERQKPSFHLLDDILLTVK